MQSLILPLYCMGLSFQTAEVSPSGVCPSQGPQTLYSKCIYVCVCACVCVCVHARVF